MTHNSIAIIDGSANPEFTRAVLRAHPQLRNALVENLISKFSDGESRIEMEGSVRNKDVFLLQATSPPVNDNLVVLCLILDALKRLSCRRVTAVIPYFGYARQDKSVAPGSPISARAVANMIQAMGADQIITMDLHAAQIQGYFECPVQNISAFPLFSRYIEHAFHPEDLVIVSPDVGGVTRSVEYVKHIGCAAAVIHKTRVTPNSVAKMALLGDVYGKTAIIVDDMIDTAGTICAASQLLRSAGARFVFAFATHGVFSGNALAVACASAFDQIYVTDTIKFTDLSDTAWM